MKEKIFELLHKLLVIAIIIGIGALISWIFYHLKRKDLFGGFIGGMVVGVIGALIGAFLLDPILVWVVDLLVVRLSLKAGVNIVAALLCGFFAVFIMNKLNHDRDRTKY